MLFRTKVFAFRGPKSVEKLSKHELLAFLWLHSVHKFEVFGHFMMVFKFLNNMVILEIREGSVQQIVLKNA